MTLTLTLPIGELLYTGKQVTFQTPCASEGLTGLIVDGVTYDLVNALGTQLVANSFDTGAMVSVIFDMDKRKAYVQNADTNAYLENRFEEVDKVFVAEYGVTTYAEISEAYNARKTCFCISGDGLRVLPLRSFTETSAKFIGFTDSPNKATIITLTASGTWIPAATITMIPISGGTMTGALVAQNNTNYTTKQVRNIILVADGDAIPAGANGDICLVYTP